MLHKYTILKIPGSIPGTNLVTVMLEGPSSFLIYFKNTVDRNGDVERFDVGGQTYLKYECKGIWCGLVIRFDAKHCITIAKDQVQIPIQREGYVYTIVTISANLTNLFGKILIIMIYETGPRSQLSPCCSPCKFVFFFRNFNIHII